MWSAPPGPAPPLSHLVSFRFHIYIIFTGGTISGLYLSAMSIDRLIAVRFPMAAIQLCTTKRAKVTVLLITFPIALIYVHIFFIFKYVEDLQSGE
jgi:hypothetical protein